MPTRDGLRWWLLVLLACPVLLYSGAYVWARATHRLVFYGSFVARPEVTHGLGFSTWEIVFAPATWAEGGLRGQLRR